MFDTDPGDSPAPILQTSEDADGVIHEMSVRPSKDLGADSQGGGQKWLDDHPDPAGSTRFDEVVKREWVSDWQIKKSAWMLRRFAEMRLKIQRSAIGLNLPLHAEQ